ncbi:hypothetical protein MPTK1_1g28860 [Marchantia polymorpha subsp. ruderalis]|uniref:Cytochrome c oxidase subunit 5C n=2 Tax=Marchantia polymorpha TaxID=3197 RepID=A0AAF6AVC9_MARPO|nr:hypothetical protein MARPO_0107s0003 [Marchantia polymorpha]BBN00400.1 hypothetical protein Mp_1g28860 [Marchantia polymorpha subsp. ruderalis]|eukprot:PTQ31726.1 hypothetical protein MARPO_0107s0003 [Marchantia polymorpha]
MAQAKLAQHAVKTATSGTGPSVIKEIVYGTGLGIFVGSFWKMYHVNSRRKVEDFYASYEKGEITVEAQG